MIEDPQGFADVGARTRQLFGDDSVWEGPLYTRVARSVYTEHVPEIPVRRNVYTRTTP